MFALRLPWTFLDRWGFEPQTPAMRKQCSTAELSALLGYNFLRLYSNLIIQLF